LATQISAIESQARAQLEELSPRHWTSAELTKIIGNGIKDLWRSIVDLKGEHFLVVNPTDVTMPANSETLQGVPKNVHKIYLIEPADISDTSTATDAIWRSFLSITTTNISSLLVRSQLHLRMKPIQSSMRLLERVALPLLQSST